MKREITVVKEGTTKKMNLSVLIVLTESEAEKLNCKGLIQRIDNLAKDFHINWAVRKSANNEIIDISRICQNGIIDDAFIHQLEIDAAKFMSELGKVKLEKKDTDNPVDENVTFIKSLLNDMNLSMDDENRVIGAYIMCMGPSCLPFSIQWGKIGYDTLKEICELYLQAHEQN